MLMRSTISPPLASSGNILLCGLSPSDRSLLEPHLEQVQVKRGAELIRAGQPLSDVYFPDAGLFSLEEQPSPCRDPIEVAIIGREGLLGWPALLGCGHSNHRVTARGRRALVQRIAVADLRDACATSATLSDALLRFVHFVIVQMGRTITSHADDDLDRRVARWLLMRHDRLGGDELSVCHDEVAASLGVRRASITDKLHILEGELFVRCHRGRVLIRNRDGLEAFAGPAYGNPEAHYRHMIAPFGKNKRSDLITTSARELGAVV